VDCHYAECRGAQLSLCPHPPSFSLPKTEKVFPLRKKVVIKDFNGLKVITQEVVVGIIFFDVIPIPGKRTRLFDNESYCHLSLMFDWSTS
jgi:hypothetical protein